MHIRVEWRSVIFNKLPGYSIFYYERRIPTFCCLIFDNLRQLRMPVTTFNPYRRGGTCDSLPGVEFLTKHSKTLIFGRFYKLTFWWICDFRKTDFCSRNFCFKLILPCHGQYNYHNFILMIKLFTPNGLLCSF